jgi:hypothetical protein
MTRIARRLPVLIVFLLLVAACGDQPDSAQLPPAGDDVPPAAGACLEGTEDCNDTLYPGDEPVDLPPSGDVSGQPLPPSEALTVSEAVGTEGVIVVSGFYVDTGSGPMLCEALAESFPPQCGGASVPLADISPIDPDEIQTEQGTSWTDRVVTIVGEMVDGTLAPTPMSA